MAIVYSTAHRQSIYRHVEAAIHINSHRGTHAAIITITDGRHRLTKPLLLLLRESDYPTPERAWLRAYQEACEWVGRHLHGSRVFIAEGVERQTRPAERRWRAA